MSKSAWYFVKLLSKGSRPEVFYSQVIPKNSQKKTRDEVMSLFKNDSITVFIKDYLKKCEQIYKNCKKSNNSSA